MLAIVFFLLHFLITILKYYVTPTIILIDAKRRGSNNLDFSNAGPKCILPVNTVVKSDERRSSRRHIDVNDLFGKLFLSPVDICVVSLLCFIMYINRMKNTVYFTHIFIWKHILQLLCINIDSADFVRISFICNWQIYVYTYTHVLYLIYIYIYIYILLLNYVIGSECPKKKNDAIVRTISTSTSSFRLNEAHTPAQTSTVKKPERTRSVYPEKEKCPQPTKSQVDNVLRACLQEPSITAVDNKLAMSKYDRARVALGIYIIYNMYLYIHIHIYIYIIYT